MNEDKDLFHFGADSDDDDDNEDDDVDDGGFIMTCFYFLYQASRLRL